MASTAFSALVSALDEVSHLEEANPSPTGAAPRRPEITRVIGRASVVLLSSHFERYIYRINEETTAYLAAEGVTGDQLPNDVRLLHSKPAIDDTFAVSWVNRATPLTQFVTTDLWLWQSGVSGELDSARLLAWMKAPNPKNLVRYYRYWEIEDIFSAITRRSNTRRDLRLSIQTLVEKRNNIAHGDLAEQATQRDVRVFATAVRTFCDRADGKLARQIRLLFRTPLPW